MAAAALGASAFQDPFTNPAFWDSITVSGITWQGKFEIKEAGRKYKWDVKDAPGIQGATQTYRGKRPKEFRITFYIWTPAQYSLWRQFSQLFKYDGVKGLVIPVDIYHPSLANIDVSQVLCDDLGPVEKMSDDLMFGAVVHVREYFPPIPINATTTPLGAATVNPPVVPGQVPNPAIAALEATIQTRAQTAANMGLPGGLP